MATWASGGAGVLVAPPVGVATRWGRGPVTTPFLAGKIARERWLTSIHRVIHCHVQAKVRLLFTRYFFFLRLFSNWPKKEKWLSEFHFLMSLFYFILIFVSQGSDSFTTRIKDSKYVFFIFPSLKSVSHFQYTHLFMYWTSNICKNNDLASQTFNFAIQHRR